MNETIVDLQIFPSHLVKHAHVSQLVYKGQVPSVLLHLQSKTRSKDSCILKNLELEYSIFPFDDGKTIIFESFGVSSQRQAVMAFEKTPTLLYTI